MQFYGFWTVPLPETAAGGEGHTIYIARGVVSIPAVSKSGTVQKP